MILIVPCIKKFKCSESQHQEINRKIEKYVNKTKLFPDFWDIKKLIGRVNQEKGLNLSDIQMHNEAESIFIAVGKRLQKRRLVDDGTMIHSYLKEEDTGDPAANDLELDSKLRELGRVAEQKLNKVFEEFACKQANGANDDDDDTEEDVCDDSDDQEAQTNDINDDIESLKSDNDDGVDADDPLENVEIVDEDVIDDSDQSEEIDCESN